MNVCVCVCVRACIHVLTNLKYAICLFVELDINCCTSCSKGNACSDLLSLVAPVLSCVSRAMVDCRAFSMLQSAIRLVMSKLDMNWWPSGRDSSWDTPEGREGVNKSCN